MHFSKPQSETDILRSMVLIGIAFILVLAALPPALTATMLEVYASSNEDDEESDDGGDDSSDSERAVPSDTSSQSNGGQDEDGDIVTYTDNPPDDPVFITSYRVDKDSSLGNDVLNIIGEIRNTDSVSADFVEIIATFYDATNSTLGSDFTFTDPSDLDPGQSAPFEMNAGIFKDLPVDDIRYVKFHVDWQ
jgi:hypothetical protein